MGLIGNALGQRVYFDTNIIVYAVEGFADYAGKTKALLEAMDAAEIVAVTSELTLAEVLVKPFRDGDLRVQQAYKDFLLPTTALEIVPINRQILESAAECRAVSKLKLPDAIHWVTCQSCQCESFLTNDETFKSLLSTDVRILSEIEFQ
jgi:predicted nucleic acid-binding protein